MEIRVPKWHLELETFETFRTAFVLEGNIFDLHAYPNKQSDDTIQWDMLKLDQYLFNYLSNKGYDSIIFYNHIDGFYNEFSKAHFDNFIKRLAKDKSAEQIPESEEEPQKGPVYPVSLDKATVLVRTAMNNTKGASAVIMNLASRYITSPDNIQENERDFFTRLLLSTIKPTQVKTSKGQILNNLLFIITNKTNDIPPWLYIDNPYMKVLNITKPDRAIRQQFIDSQLRFFSGISDLNNDEIKKYKNKFVDLTDGFKNIDLHGLRVLCKQKQIPLTKIQDAVNLFKYGIKENPWDNLDEDKLINAEKEIKRRVKGQEPCIIQTVDIIKRAATGLSGLQHSSSSSKPRGILFFAGPTGTGKTELAKTLANLLFGDDSACIRFDMSEYQQPHSDQKLLGAPPGYVGYEAGGQLTNATKEKPFSILLFDEIEKAHPSIFDKFLQILEDGRMTDGQGQTVYFTESIIIFTSNLGIVRDNQGIREYNVTAEMGYKEIKEKVLDSIKEFFTLKLGRPEILNRIGDNFVVFDFIRQEIAEEIIDSQLEKIRVSLKENKKIKLEISQEARAFISSKALANLDNGGRGIGNSIEKHFMNPLARYLFDNRILNNYRVKINRLLEEDEMVKIDWEVEAINVD